MKKWLLFSCALLVAGFTAAAGALSSGAAKEALRKELRTQEWAFTPSVRQAYIEYAEAVVRETYDTKKINEKTWKWFKSRPQVMSALASAVDPVDPRMFLNFQRVCQSLGPQQADKWRQLALAYVIRWRDRYFPVELLPRAVFDPQKMERLVFNNKKGRGGDFALLGDDDPCPKATDEERRLGEWLAGVQSLASKNPKLTIPNMLKMPVHEINLMTQKMPDDKPMLTKFPNWENVALAGRLYPRYFDCTPSPQKAILTKIYRNSRIPPRSDRPAFRMDHAEWPILLYAADLDSLDETSFIFGYFASKKQVPPMGLGQQASSSGGADINKNDPNFRYARSNWHPDKFIRTYNGSRKDQGGKSWAWCMNALNVAATAVAAPPDGKFYYMGGKGNYTYFLTCADNAFTGVGSSASWHLPQLETVNPSSPARGAVLHSNFIGLAATVNQGLQEYEDARMALAAIRLLQLSRQQRVLLLESVFKENPINGDVLYRLAAEYRQMQDAKATLKMLNAARAYAAHGFKLPVSPSAAKTGRGAMKKILKDAEPDYGRVPVVSVNSNPWFFLTCAEIATQYLRDNGGKEKGLFRAELEYLRKAASGCGDKPIVRAIDTLGGLVN